MWAGKQQRSLKQGRLMVRTMACGPAYVGSLDCRAVKGQDARARPRVMLSLRDAELKRSAHGLESPFSRCHR